MVLYFLISLALTELLGLLLWRIWERTTGERMETTKELLELSGTVDEIIFTNEENGYTVLRLACGGGEPVTVTGFLPFAAPGEQLTVGGSWVSHSGYGQQFQAEYADRRMPRGAQAVYEYLASRAVNGIGRYAGKSAACALGENGAPGCVRYRSVYQHNAAMSVP